jgi:hypothetical protein
MNTHVRSIRRRSAITVAVLTLAFSALALPAHAAAAPTVGSFTPTSGAPGTLVAVTGSGFTGGLFGVSSVTFNGAGATFNVVDDQHLSTTVPLGATTGKIAVATSDGTGTSATDFTVVSGPTITGFSPPSGVPGTLVTINGSHFTGVNGVKFNGVATTFNLISDGQVTATVPAGASTGKITLTTPTGTATSSSNFTVTSSTAPTISSFSPSSGAVGTLVTINGNHFTGVNGVRFNGVGAGFSFVNDNKVTATVPAGASTGKITLTTPSGTATSSGTFTVSGGGKHERSVWLNVSGKHASGSVSVDDGYSACATNVPVVIKRLHHGEWHWVTTTSTGSDGSYRALIGGKNGRYKAKAKEITLVNGAVCGGDQSPVVHR